MKQLRYRGEFLSIRGTVWRVEILQDAAAPYTVKELEFDGTPLVLEWPKTDKEEVLCGSRATLTLISPGDRNFIDLYTIKPATIRMDVYRDGALYWSGTLDPEFYEEPYEQAAGYPVSLTFSDFGILDRLNLKLRGRHTLREYLVDALACAGLPYTGYDSGYVSTTFPGSTAPLTGSEITVASDNFVDEDGEWSSLKKVVEGILQPLGMKLIQRAGRVWLYDLNGLYSRSKPVPVEWSGDSQTLGVDKVANNVTITFSPYAKSDLLPAFEYTGAHSPDVRNDGTKVTTDAKYKNYVSFFDDYKKETMANGAGGTSFTLFYGGDCKGLDRVGAHATCFFMEPNGGGGEHAGVLWDYRLALGEFLKTDRTLAFATPVPRWERGPGLQPATKYLTGSGYEVFVTEPVYLPPYPSDDRRGHYLRLTMETLLDARYNPLGNGEAKFNYPEWDGDLKVCSAFVFIPVRVLLKDASGKVVMHYSNIWNTTQGRPANLSAAQGEWLEGPPREVHDCYLEYYNLDDLKRDAGIRGWKANRHNIGRPDGQNGRPEVGPTADAFKQLGDGEFIPYPPRDGYLSIEVYPGVLGYDYAEGDARLPFGQPGSAWERHGFYDKVRWVAYKPPKLELVKNSYTMSTDDMDDIEYRGWVNRDAKEGISLETVCGTAEDMSPTARGAYYDARTSRPLLKLARAGRTDQPERLLIGTLYSQFATRMTTLSGEAGFGSGTLTTFTEANQNGRRFMLLEDTQDLRMEWGDALYCELRPDEYRDN